MAVTIASQKSSEPKRGDFLTKRHAKLHYKTRPITATLEHPLILDIKLLKKLDMTTFTKKGLMALSKFCGISLIDKTHPKKKPKKCLRTIQCGSKKPMEIDHGELNLGQIADSDRRESRAKRKLVKQISKGKPRIRFKMAKEDSSPDEDALDVVCKNHGVVLKTLNRITNSTNDKPGEKKTNIARVPTDTVDNIIPEPCKTCSRSEHPERFHSHPKMLTRLASQEKSNGKKLEEQFRDQDGTKNPAGDKKEEGKKNSCAKETEEKSIQGSQFHDEKRSQNSSRCGNKSPAKSSSSTSSLPVSPNKTKLKSLRSPFTSSQSATKSKEDIVKQPKKPATQQKDEKMSADESMKFVTGCYVCGKQLSPKSRMKHEKTCIVEWRAQNVLVSGEKRRPEPKRPDFRFTASGDLDCEGSFESIWANHVDSLVPCKKCGRTFFPDRIERHENCCNNAPVSVKYRH